MLRQLVLYSICVFFRSREEKTTKSASLQSVPEIIDEEKDADNSRVTPPVAIESGEIIEIEPLEEGETRDSTPELGQITDGGSEKEHIERWVMILRI